VDEISLDDEELQDVSPEELAREISEQNSLRIRVPLPSVNRSNSHLDIVSDYLDASYALEYLGKHYEKHVLKKKWDRTYFPYFELTIFDANPTELADSVLYLIWGFQYPELEEDETDFLNYRESVNEYEITLTEGAPLFPEIIDDYFANLINGAYFELEPDVFEDQIKAFPERKFGFWRAAHYNQDDSRVFISVDSWIIPSEIELFSAFKALGYEESPSFLNAELLLIDGRVIAVTEGLGLEISLEAFLQCIGCAEECIKSEEFRHKYDWARDLMMRDFSPTRKLSPAKSLGNLELKKLKCYVSEYREFLIIETFAAKCVIFSVSTLTKSEAAHLSELACNISSSISDEVFSHSDIALPWLTIDDEKFEELCYDIVYHNPKFDRTTIRKMGKSRSRDGGRDIVVYTKPEIGKKPKKYIFQCKLYAPKSSINTSNLTSISDVVDQYGADGYGLMCSCYIDSTVYDRLDGIAANRSIQVETWSKFELERYVARRSLIKARFFQNIK
jgi:hypothetical protein